MKRETKTRVKTGGTAGKKPAAKAKVASAKPAVATKTRKTLEAAKPAVSLTAKPKAEIETKPRMVAKPKVEAAKAAPKRPVAKLPTRPVKPGPAVAAKPTPVRSEKPSRKTFSIPPVLLEGDLPPTPSVSGPGARYALTPETIVSQVAAPAGELPLSYGTKNLFLAARDPHWLFASWDLTHAQQQEHNKRSRDGHLILRAFANDEREPAVPDQHAHPESRSWFIHVPRAETRYHAELGFYEGDKWISVATSKSTFTPPDAPAKELATEFATIPPNVSFQQIVEIVQDFVRENEPLMETVLKASAAASSERSREEEPEKHQPEKTEVSFPQPPTAPETVSILESTPTVRPAARIQPSRTFRAELPVRIERREDWTPAQARALSELISIDAYRRVWMGSVEITELVRRHLQEEAGSIAAADLARGKPEILPGPEAPSSMFGGEMPPPGGKDFWFKVNAELIVYGATRPDATVTIAGRAIKLRPDGSFSFRFSLPDGRYQLPAIAISRDGDDGREARLEFSRSTNYRGHVEEHAQDQALRPPRAENVA